MHAAFLCLQINIHNTIEEKEMVIKSAKYTETRN